MVKYSRESDSVFDAVSHEIRRKILIRLLEKPATVMELAHPFDVSLPAITKHLHILEKANLIIRRKEGRTYVLSLHSKPLLQIKRWLLFYEQAWIKEL